MAVVVSQEVYDGLEEVREGGEINMLDRGGVIELAYEYGYPATADWILDNKSEYARGIFNGFEVA